MFSRNVMDFGAKGDGATLDTAAIQQALDAGGVVYFPAGTYLTGTIYLRSHGGLELAPGAVLLASTDPAQYNADDFIPENRVFTSENVSGAHLVVADHVENVVIRGGGCIHGNGTAVYDQLDPDHPIHYQIRGWRMGQMLFFVNSRNITIDGVELLHAQYWTCFLHGCENVHIRGLRVENEQPTPNGDGIDVDCCRFVTISDCIIRTGDDCITLRGNDVPLGGSRPCEFVTVTNCILSTRCNAFRIGVGYGVVRKCTISNTIVRDTRTAICLVSQYSPASTGVQIEDIMFSNLYLDCARPFLIATTPRGIRQEEAKCICRISFNHIRGNAIHGSIIQGSRPGYVRDIRFTDVRLDYRAGENVLLQIPEGGFSEFGKQGQPSAAFFLQQAEQVRFNDVGVTFADDDPIRRSGILAVGSTFSAAGCDFPETDRV